MRVSKAMTVVTLAAMLLAGCGKGPATGVDAEATTKRLAAAKTATPAKAPAASTGTTKPATTTKAPGVTTTPGKAATTPAATATAKPAADGEGAVKLTVRLWGTAPVTSLALQVTSVDDPTQTADVPLTLDGPEVTWENASLPAGTYDLQIAALNGKGEKMGGGSTQALVVAGELADVTLDVTVDKATPVTSPSGLASPTATPTPDSGVLTTPSPTPTPAATATPATGMGGTLGLRVEVF